MILVSYSVVLDKCNITKLLISEVSAEFGAIKELVSIKSMHVTIKRRIYLFLS